MPGHNIPDILEHMIYPSTWKAFKTPEGIALAGGKTVPSAVAGYAPGCLFIHSDGASAVDILYFNTGTSTSCTFEAVNTITDAELGDTIALGASGSAGTLDIFPTTSSKGSLRFDVADQTGDTRTIIRLAAQGGAYVHTIPNAGASSNFLMSQGNQTIAGVQTFTAAPFFTPGSDTISTALGFGATTTEGVQVRVLDESVVIGGAAAAFDLTSDITDASVILGVQANLETAVTATTATKVGVGIAANPDLYGLTSGLTKNLKIDTIPDWAVLSGAEDMQIYACDNAGAAAGTLDSGTVRVRVVILATNSLDDAA